MSVKCSNPTCTAKFDPDTGEFFWDLVDLGEMSIGRVTLSIKDTMGPGLDTEEDFDFCCDTCLATWIVARVGWVALDPRTVDTSGSFDVVTGELMSPEA